MAGSTAVDTDHVVMATEADAAVASVVDAEVEIGEDEGEGEGTSEEAAEDIVAEEEEEGGNRPSTLVCRQSNHQQPYAVIRPLHVHSFAPRWCSIYPLYHSMWLRSAKGRGCLIPMRFCSFARRREAHH